MKNPHPGIIFQDWLTKNGMTQERAAGLLRVNRVGINTFINGRKSLTARMAVRLELLTQVGAYMWMIAQVKHDLEKARKEKW